MQDHHYVLLTYAGKGNLVKVKEIADLIMQDKILGYQNVCKGDYDDRTALHLACEKGHSDIAKMIAFSLMLPLLALAAAGLGFIAPFIAAGSAALVVLGVGMLAVSLAFGAMGGVDIEKIKILGEVLPSIGLAAAKLGIMAPFIAAGSAAMVLLSVGMLAIGLGSAAMGNVDAEQLRIFSEVLPGLGLAMAGLGFMAPFIIMGSFALGAMSLALVPLALMGPGLAIASTALMGMAQALREVGSALGEIDGSKLDKLED